MEDLYEAEVVIVAGQNPGTNHPRMLTALEKCKKNGGTIISINPLAETGLINFKNPQKVGDMLSSGTNIAVAAPFTTALAGALLAAEALKRSTEALAPYTLGPNSLGIQYCEDLHTPESGLVDAVFEVPAECICQSVRRRRLTREIRGRSA